MGPNASMTIIMMREIHVIACEVDWLMTMIQEWNSVPGQELDVELALREALGNAVLHRNRQDSKKRVHISCEIEFGGEVSIVVRDEGKGFDLTKVSDPKTIDNIEAAHGRGIYLMRALMDEVHFGRGCTE